MRVGLVITELYVGGAEKCLTELAIGLAEAGDDVRVFSLGSLPTGPRAALVDRLAEANIDVTSGQADSSLRTLAAFRRLKRWMKESPPDVCQTFLYHANVLGTLAAKSAGVPCRLGGLRVAESRSLRCRIETAAIARMQKLVCVSSAVQTFAASRLNCDREKSVVIPNGVDTERFAEAAPFDWTQLGWPADSVVSLFVGRLHPQKGIELLRRQIDVLSTPGSDRRLLLIGEGPLLAELTDWAERVGGDRVRLLPWQSEVAPFMRAARLLVLPSRYEGMPNVVLEAMAAGKPVVCSRVEGSEELLGGSIDRQSFSPGDDGAMKKLVDQYLADESLSESAGQENLDRVKERFTIPAMVAAYRSLYQRVRETRRLDD